MSLVLRQIKVYARIVLLVAVVLVVGLVILYNRSNTVDVWFFASYRDVIVLWLLACTAFGSVLALWIVAWSLGLWRDVRELGREAEREKSEQQQRELATKLAETEKRIDEKLKKGISGEENP